ncbi:putative membrane protein [Rhodanobacter sp. TND4EL1]
MSQRSTQDDGDLPKARRWRPWGFAKGRPWTVVSLLIFLAAVGGLLVSGLALPKALLLGFDLAAVIFLGLLAHLFNQAVPATMRQQAKAIDTGRWSVLFGGVLLSAVVLGALTLELHAAKGGGLLDLLVSVPSVILSWLFLNVMFAVHYAHGYYGDLGEEHEGLEFPETPDPDYWDFAYFSIVIGMTFQVSDVQITSNYLRRVALLHSVIAFFFNVFIIAITVNIVAGQ